MSENANIISRITLGGKTYELKSNITPKIITWEELKKLKNSNELLPGLKYRIVDYYASVNSNGSAYGLSTVDIDSLNFDIIVEALSINVLSEDALVCRSDEDNLIQKFNAWEIKYCLDNDTSRFAWADTENGKGVIYYMKDEYGNSAYYDFKGILFDNSFTFGDSIDYSSSDINDKNVCKNNTIGYCFNEKGYPNKINISKGSRNNTIGDNCSNILIGNNSCNNKIGNNCCQLNFNTINNSKIGDNCNNIISNHEINNISILDNNRQLILKTQNEGDTINNVKFLEYKGYQLGTTTVVLNPEETITTVEISNNYDNNYKTSTSPILEIEDNFKKLSDFNTLKDLTNTLNNWHGETIDSTKDFIGNFRTKVAGIPIEIFSTVLGYNKDVEDDIDTSIWIQEIKGAIDIDKGAVNHLGSTEYGYGFIDTKFIGSNNREWYTRTYRQGLRFVSPTNNSGIHTLRRIYNGSLGGWGEWVDSDNPYITSPLYGKSILILGGSFAHNMKAYMGDDNSGFGFKVEGREYAMQNYIAKQLGLKRFDNFAVSGNGACISNNAFSCNIYQQLTDALACATANNYKYDAIIFQGGINDYQANSPLGSLTDLAGDNTFYASYKKIINLARLHERSKDAKLFMTTPFKAFHKMECWKSTEQTVNTVGYRYYDYLQAIRDISQYASIPLLDIWSIQQVDSNNYGRYYRNEANDDCHPNGQGYLQVAPAFIEFLAWGKGGVSVDIQSYMKTVIPIATTENAGLMSSGDKNLLQKLIDKNFPLIVTLKSNISTTTSNALNILEGSKNIELSWSLKYEGNTNNEDLSNYMGELKIGDNIEIISDLSISKKVISLDKTTTISLTVNNKVGKTTIYFALPFYSANIPLNRSLEISDLLKISPIPTTLSNLSNQNIVGLIEDYKYIIAVPDNINITGAKDINTGFGFPLVEDGNIEIEGYQYKLYTSNELAAETNWTIKIS